MVDAQRRARDHSALGFGDRRQVTYGELASRTDQVAGAFDRAGIAREERVACLVLDQIEYVELFWGGVKAGVIPVALNTLLSADVYDTILRDCRATCRFPIVRRRASTLRWNS